MMSSGSVLDNKGMYTRCIAAAVDVSCDEQQQQY
jgi:hypothetical protein